MNATATVVDGQLSVFRPNVLMRTGGSTSKAKLPPQISKAEAIRIGHSFLRSVNGHAFISGTSMFSGIRILFGFLKTSNRKLPKSVRETELFLADSQKHVLIGQLPNNPSIETRQTLWSYYANLIRQLMTDKMLPTVMVPHMKLPRGQLLDDSSKSGVLGESLTALPQPLTSGDIWPDCYLGAPSYAASTDAFLDHVHTKLKHLAHETVTAAAEYWNTRIEKLRELRRKVDSISPQRAAEILRSLNGKTIHHFPPEIDPKTEQGVINILAIMKYMLVNHDDVQKLSWISFANSTPRLAFTIYRQAQVTKAIIRFTGREPLHNEKVWRALEDALGLPNITDFSAAMVVLINDNPKFNPMALGQAKITNKNGKRYLIAETGHKQAMFSVEKRRSKSRKKSYLSDRSKSIIHEILENTVLLRKKLEQSGHPAEHSLFIEISTLGINESIDAQHQFSGKKYSLWTALEDRLTVAGLDQSSFSLSAVRNTQGILEWFRTGSVRMMAKKMGNSIKTVLNSYMPPWILRRQYERIARAFQQKMILLANIKCPWLLAASDFNTTNDLKAFIASTLLHPNGRDKFTNVMEEDFRNQFPDEFEPFEHIKSKFLCLNLAPEALAALRLYLEISEENPDSISINESGAETPSLPASDLKLLARMMQAVVELPITSAAAKAVRTNLQGNSFKELTISWHHSTELLSSWKHDAVHPRLT